MLQENDRLSEKNDRLSQKNGQEKGILVCCLCGKGGGCLKVRFIHDPGLEEPEVIISAKAMTPQIRKTMEWLSGLLVGPIAAFDQEKAILLELESILRFFADGKGVSVQTDAGIFAVKYRL